MREIKHMMIYPQEILQITPVYEILLIWVRVIGP